MERLGWVILLTLGFVASARAAPRRILLVGDSQSVGTFGRTFAKDLRRRGRSEVLVVARCGAAPLHYLEPGHVNCGFYERMRDGTTLGPASGNRPVDLLETWLDRETPDTVIMQLGGNLLHASEAVWESQVSRTLEVLAAHGAPTCYWVGPPPGWARPQARFEEFYRFLAARLAGRCALYDSRVGLVYPEDTGDGVHLDRISLRDLHDRFGCALDGSESSLRPECLTGAQRARSWAGRVATWVGATLYRRGPSASPGAR